jgi:hypothetical protein
MPNPYLSGRIPVELDKQVDEFLARTGETKTQMLIKAVSAYIGAEPPPLKVAGDRRIENLEREVAQLKGAVQSLYEKFATSNPKTENPKIEVELINVFDNTDDNTDNIERCDKIDETFNDFNNTYDNNHHPVQIEQANVTDNSDNSDNISDVIYPADVTPTINDEKNFLNIDTSQAAKLTKLDPKKFTDLRGACNRKLKKENKSLPEKQILECPIKMTPLSEVKIEKIPYDIFYVGQSPEGRNLWNLIPKTTLDEPVQLSLVTDNK